MMTPESHTPFNGRVFAALILSCIFGTILVFLGTYSWLKWTTDQQESTRVSVAYTASLAKLALQQVNYNHAFVYAMCKRFNRDEQISADLAKRRDAIERAYPHAGTDPQYRAALTKLLADSKKDRAYVVQLNCPAAMQRAIASAPSLFTPEPLLRVAK